MARCTAESALDAARCPTIVDTRRCQGGQEPMSARTNRNTNEYRITIRPLSKDEGGGYLVEYPEIPGCMSDGETIEEAIANGREALRFAIASSMVSPEGATARHRSGAV